MSPTIAHWEEKSALLASISLGYTHLGVNGCSEVVRVGVPEALQGDGAEELADNEPAEDRSVSLVLKLFSSLEKTYNVYALMKKPLSCVGATSER